MRIRIVHSPALASIDGIRLDTFEVGTEYDVGSTLASLLLAEGWAVPADQKPSVEPEGTGRIEPGRSEDPPNLIRDSYPSWFDQFGLGPLFRRRQ
jgi:hypothetical protein